MRSEIGLKVISHVRRERGLSVIQNFPTHPVEHL